MFIVDNPRTVLVHHLSVERKELQERLTKLKILKRYVEVRLSPSRWNVTDAGYGDDAIAMIFVEGRIDEIDKQISDHLKS